MIRCAVMALALSAVAAAKAPVPKSGSSLERANALIASRRFDEAEAILRNAMQENPSANGHHLALGRMLVAKGKPADGYLEMVYEGLRAGAAPESKQGFEAAREVRERNRGIDMNDARYIHEAELAINVDPEESERLLGLVSKERSTHFVVRFFLAEARMRSGGYAAALEELRKLSALDPSFAPSVVLEAMSLRALRRPDEAEAAAARARKIAPDHWALKSLEVLSLPLPTPIPSPPPR